MKKTYGRINRWSILASVCIAVTCAFFAGCEDRSAVSDVVRSESSSADSSAALQEDVTFEYLGYDDGILQVKMVNHTDGEVMYGHPFTLYQKKGSKWEMLENDLAFLALEMCLEAGEDTVLEMHFEDSDELPEGTYQLEKEYTAGGKSQVGHLIFDIT